MMERYVCSTSTPKHTQNFTPLSIWLVPFNHCSKLSKIFSLKSVLTDSGDTFPIPSQSRGENSGKWNSMRIWLHQQSKPVVQKASPRTSSIPDQILGPTYLQTLHSLCCFLSSSSSLKVVVISISCRSRI